MAKIIKKKDTISKDKNTVKTKSTVKTRQCLVSTNKPTSKESLVSTSKPTSKKALVSSKSVEKADMVEKMITASSYFNESQIVFQGVKTHNLKNIDITLPKNKIITITGVSGSGKSSLAFDTIYKEGQFRYIESLSSYLRQFFNLGERPDVDFCSGLSPAIAIEQNKGIGNSRSTVGTLTEIDDYLRLLFAKLGDTYCYSCGNDIKPHTIDQIINTISDEFTNQKIYLLQDLGEIKTKEDLLKFVKKNRTKLEKGKGFTRYMILQDEKNTTSKKKLEAIEYFYLEDPNIQNDYFPIKIYGIYDRVTIEDSKIPRLKEDIIKILQESKKFGVHCENTDIKWFTDKMYCPSCNIEYPAFTPQHFSPNRQEGACTNCHGLGEVLQADLDRIIDPYSPYLKAILPRRDSNYGQAVLKKIAFKYDISESAIWKDLPEWFHHVVINGDNELLRVNTFGDKYVSVKYEGIENILKDQYAKGLLTVDFQTMLEMRSCTTCNGSKLAKESLYVFLTLDKKDVPKTSIFKDDSNNFICRSIEEKKWDFSKPINDSKIKFNIRDLHQTKLSDLVEFFKLFMGVSKKDIRLIDRIIMPLMDRASTIQDLGLGYITLHRQIGTLSGGEVQRIRLAKQLGNKLTGIVYVLDEPTIGLSEREIKKAIAAIKRLQTMGNTVIVVEHNEEFIEASDRIVEIGPAAGDFGGNVVFNGSYQDFLKSDCLTAAYVLGKKKVNVNFEHRPSNNILSIKKAAKFNLQSIDVQIKLGSFTIITGSSGAGKTTLMYTTLYRFLNDKQKFIQSFIRFNLLKKGRDRQKIITAPVMNKEEYQNYENLALQEFYKDLAVDTITGFEEIKNTIYVDQSSIGKTPRSCPATFIGVFDKIRTLYAGTSQAKYLGFASGYFSFNSDKGACPACQGYGYKKIELQFLPDTYIPCELCRGKRYKPEILEITWHGKNITEVLEMYIEDALEFFKDIGNIEEELRLMNEIGLGYLRMGQPAHTLSGGESQRLKLVKHLLKSYKGHTIYFLDEPTVGLHPQDIEKLLLVLKKFLDNGDTILMIEHDNNILEFADDIIRLDEGALVKD